MSSAFDSIIKDTLDGHQDTVSQFRQECSATIAEMATQAISVLRSGNKICFFGNGGSAADSQHLATEFVVRFTRNRRALASIAFTTDTSILTAIGNDFGFDQIFARQVEGLCLPGDLVIGISTSGTSPNVVEGLKKARDLDINSFAFTGKKGNECAENADHCLQVPSSITARIQECHLLAGHIICDICEAAFA